VPQTYLKAQSLTHHYDGETLFSGVDLVLNHGDRVGLVGPNGVGKSTLLALLAGRLKPVSGHVTRAPDAVVGWFEQQVPEPGATVGDYLAGGLGEVTALGRRMRELERALDHAPADGTERLLSEYGAVQDRWTALHGWTAQARLDEVRDRLGLGHLAPDTPLFRVSGGEQARLTLARLLLAAPDILILDEPTSHLDADGSAWLGEYLSRFPGAVLLVTHDRALLDRAVTRIIELDGIHEEPQHYEGGYTAYRAEKARRWQTLLLGYEAQEKYRRRLAADIESTKGHAAGTELTTRNDKLRRYAKKVAKKAKARERRLERQIQSIRWIEQPQTRPALTLAFPDDAPADGAPLAHPVLSARGLSAKRGGRVLFDGLDLDVRAGERILFSGPNGAGKTTLLGMLAGDADPDAGAIVLGGEMGVLPQTHDTLRTPATVLDFFRSRVPVYAEDAERLLDAHLFGPDQWTARLRDLSAGELRRLLLAVLVNSPSRILVLDEPTNYLDFDALDVVEEALRAYHGTLLMVTHDRYFADRVGISRHWQLADGRFTDTPVTEARHQA
jgi:ATPase subunit of ABC transporter with duplicated ATPase domains